MSSLRDGDRELHYEDGSHRWAGGGDRTADQEEWRKRVTAHQDDHRARGYDDKPRAGRRLRRVGVVA